jgi:hypothetical protein
MPVLKHKCLVNVSTSWENMRISAAIFRFPIGWQYSGCGWKSHMLMWLSFLRFYYIGFHFQNSLIFWVFINFRFSQQF